MKSSLAFSFASRAIIFRNECIASIRFDHSHPSLLSKANSLPTKIKGNPRSHVLSPLRRPFKLPLRVYRCLDLVRCRATVFGAVGPTSLETKNEELGAWLHADVHAFIYFKANAFMRVNVFHMQTTFEWYSSSL